MFINENIKKARKQSKLSADRLVLKMALSGHIITRQTLWNWETKRSNPDVLGLEALCLALDKPLGFFFNNKRIIS